MAAIFQIGLLVLRSYAQKNLRNTKLRNHFNPTRHTFFLNQGEVYIKMAGVMDATVSPSQTLFKPKIRNARLISGNETLVTAISNSNVIPILGINKCLLSARAYSMLLDPKRFKSAGDKDILSLDKKEFSNKISGSTAKPAWLLPLLGKAMRSVGLLTYGSVRATCFFIKPDKIITNYHVVNAIKNPDLTKIKVSFDYLRDDKSTANPVWVEVDEEWDSRTTIHSRKLDYIILSLKHHVTLPDRQPLGNLVRRSVPRDGLVTIIGHPQNRPKLEETCVVVPNDQWLNEFQKRFENNRKPPPGFDYELHRYKIYKQDLESKNRDHWLSYVTSFFEGASGSPVFDMDGHVIGMHTHGYWLDGKSTIDFGVTFSGIFDDIKKYYGENEAKSLFPKIDDYRRETLLDNSQK